MEQKEMLALLKSQMHMTYAERNEIAVHMNALSERLHQQEAEIEKLVQERGTMRASSPTMEWISVDDERKPNEGEKVITHSGTGTVSTCFYFAEAGFPRSVVHWMKYEPPKPKEPTFKGVFLKEFPKAETVDGRPAFCVRKVFPYLQECNFSLIKIGHGCKECWNQPYFEPKEEGEADA